MGRLHGWWLVASLGIALSGPWADEEALRFRAQVVSLGRDIWALAMVQALRLTPVQREGLLPLAQAVQQEVARYRERYEPLLRAEKMAFAAFKEQALANQGFTPQVEGRTALLNHREHELRKHLLDRVALWERQALEMLEPWQRSLVEGRRPPLAAEDPLAHLQQILREILASRWGGVGPMGRLLMSPAFLAVLQRDAGGEGSLPEAEPEEIEVLEQELRDLRDDINLLNLLNGLYLTQEQVTRLLEVARQANTLRGIGEEGFEAQEAAQWVAALEQARRALWEGQKVSPTPRRSLQQVLNPIPPGRPRSPQVVEALLRPLVAEVEGFLSEAQRRVIEDYAPCLIPPRNLRDPVRVGQATDHEAAVGALRGLRAIPSLQYELQRGVWAEQTLQELERHGGAYPASERQRVKEALLAFADRVRSLPEVEFELSKEELAREFEGFNRQHQVKEAMKRLSNSSEVVRRKIQANLLHPRIVPLLEARLRQLETFQIPPAADLASLPEANRGACPAPRGAEPAFP